MAHKHRLILRSYLPVFIDFISGLVLITSLQCLSSWQVKLSGGRDDSKRTAHYKVIRFSLSEKCYVPF
jgi:hypothetical protein